MTQAKKSTQIHWKSSEIFTCLLFAKEMQTFVWNALNLFQKQTNNEKNKQIIIPFSASLRLPMLFPMFFQNFKSSYIHTGVSIWKFCKSDREVTKTVVLMIYWSFWRKSCTNPIVNVWNRNVITTLTQETHHDTDSYENAKIIQGIKTHTHKTYCKLNNTYNINNTQPATPEQQKNKHTIQ